jgi:hypothetical protein
MELVNSSGAVVTEASFRAANPLTSFPAVLSAADVAPFGYSFVQPAPPPTPSAFYGITEGAPTQVNGVWTQTWVQTPVPLAQAQSTQSAVIDAACAAAIVSGFTSSALGSAYTYPSKVTDQQNLAASVLASILPGVTTGWTTPFWCADSTGMWSWVNHTAAQIQQVGADSKTAILGYQSQNAQLQAQLVAANITTVDQVAAIVWPA